MNIGSGYYKKEVEITVSDAVGNKETARNSVYNDGMGNIKNLDSKLVGIGLVHLLHTDTSCDRNPHSARVKTIPHFICDISI